MPKAEFAWNARAHPTQNTRQCNCASPSNLSEYALKSLYNLAAPAKLNLFLHITGRRGDGYHLLESAFVLIDWFDTLHLEARNDGLIRRVDAIGSTGAPLPTEDLCVRAARALQKKLGTRLGADIILEKRIPAQAGMGGGSSDAATCLLGLLALWDATLSAPELAELALQLGADVPFFVAGDNAWVSGIGEHIAPLSGSAFGAQALAQLANQRFVVVKPQAGLPTQEIFAHPGLKRDTKPAILADFAANPTGFGCNDLQAIAQTLCPEMNEALEWLNAQGLAPRMTGSGSAVFAPVSNSDSGFGGYFEAAGAHSAWQHKICSMLASHPLKGWGQTIG